MQSNSNKPNILIADIQALIVEGLRVFLGKHYRIAGSVCSKYELLEALRKQVPDFLIMDPTALNFDGLNDLKEIKERFPDLGIIILTHDIAINELDELKKMGIRHILHKNADADEIITCMQALQQGKKYYSRYMLDMLVDFNDKKGILDETIQQLTASEIEIVRLIAAGMTTKEIAIKKYISFHTVMTHRKNILRKLGVSNASELIMYAIKAGIIDTIDYQI
ncbi:MAG: response regulator transcription factor [Bacteroidales bacterium]|nr:response regulator transcription factor [Bacteroidales bacterium]